jgi:hypothetical protein
MKEKQMVSICSLTDFIERTGYWPGTIKYPDPHWRLRFTGKSKKTLLWEANFLQKKATIDAPEVQSMFNEPLTVWF